MASFNFDPFSVGYKNQVCKAVDHQLPGVVCHCGHPSGWHGQSGKCYVGKQYAAIQPPCKCNNTDVVSHPEKSTAPDLAYVTSLTLGKPKIHKPRTQKVKGILAVLNSVGEGNELPLNRLLKFPHINWLRAKDELDKLINNSAYMPQYLSYYTSYGGKAFVRGAPRRPRHGFVDSRLISNRKELISLLIEIVKEDKQAEFIVMPYIEADLSGVYCPGTLALGKGHDGATSGKGAIDIPVEDEVFFTTQFLQKAGVKNSPYIELVYGEATENILPTFTQLRDGPKVDNGSPDFIPAEVMVTKVVKAEGDLLAWERKIKKLAKEPGVVIWHPGGAKVDHYAVHAITFNIPVMISREPVVGETLIKQSKVYEVNTAEVQRGFMWGLTEWLGYNEEDFNYTNQSNAYTEAACLMLAGCHLSQVWKGREDFLLGTSMGFAYRLGMLALAGELRHLIQKHDKPARESVYHKVWHNLRSLEEVQGTLWRYWDKKWVCVDEGSLDTNFQTWLAKHQSMGMGGPKWGECSLIIQELCKNVLVDGDINQAILTLNKIVNLAHNGGWLFNKFAQDHYFNAAGVYPSVVLMNAGRLAYAAKEAERGGWLPGPKQTYSFMPFNGPTTVTFAESGVKVEVQETLETLRAAWKHIGERAYKQINGNASPTTPDKPHIVGCPGCNGKLPKLIEKFKINYEKKNKGLPGEGSPEDLVDKAHVFTLMWKVFSSLGLGDYSCGKCLGCKENGVMYCEYIKWDWKNLEVWCDA